jgi:predicted nucleotidyltransferase
MTSGLSDATVQAISDVLRKYPQVHQAILYGSRAKGTYKTGSDIDLTLVGDDLTLKVLYRIMDDLDDLLLPYTFDLSIFEHIDNEALKQHIARVGVMLYVRDNYFSRVVANSD